MNTNNNPDPRYGITVVPWTFEESGETPEQWKADLHRYIDIRSTLGPNWDHGYSREEVFAVYRWAAGVLARVAYKIHGQVRYDETERGHRCHLDPHTKCGWSFQEGVTGHNGPRWAVDEWEVVPEVTIAVPTERLDHWVKITRLWVASIVADDMTPLDPVAPEHEQVVLTETTTEPQKASK